MFVKKLFKQFRLERIGSGLVVGCMTPDTRVAGSVTDLGQDCLQRLSVRRNTSRERVNIFLANSSDCLDSFIIPDKELLDT